MLRSKIKFFSEYIFIFFLLLVKLSNLLNLKLIPKTDKYDSFFHFACRTGISSEKTTFAHWIFEKLPQIRIYYEALKIDNKLQLFIGQNLADFQEIMLNLLEIKKESIFTKKTSYSIFVKNLFISRVYPTHTSRVTLDPIGRKWVSEKLRKSIKKNILKLPVRTKKIVISRKICARRRLIDEELTYKILKEKGFEILYPEKMNRIDQIINSYSANTILGLPSGSGLANMIFSKNAKLIEVLYKEKSCYYSFWFLLSRELGFDYALILAPSCGDRKDFRENDLTIDIQQLEETLSINN